MCWRNAQALCWWDMQPCLLLAALLAVMHQPLPLRLHAQMPRQHDTVESHLTATAFTVNIMCVTHSNLQFYNQAEADTATAKLNGLSFGGKTLEVVAGEAPEVAGGREASQVPIGHTVCRVHAFCVCDIRPVLYISCAWWFTAAQLSRSCRV